MDNGEWIIKNKRAIMLRMKIGLLLTPFILLSALLQSLGSFEPIFVGLAQLPLVGGMAWILMRQQDKHQDTIDKLISHFADRSEKKDQFYQQLLKDTMETIKDLSTRKPS